MRTALFSRTQPGGVFTIDDLAEHPGEIWFVSSTAAGTGDTVGHGKNPDSPFATLAYAFSSDLVASGDVVYVLPGHAETIAAAGGITQDIAGVKVIGLGWGSNRPTFTWSATASTWVISAANSVVKNILTTSTIAGVVKLFNISAANAHFDAVDYAEDGTTDALQFILTTAACDGLRVENCNWYRGTTAASALSQWIKLVGVDNAVIRNNFLNSKGYATSNPINSAVAVVTTECLNLQVLDNRFYDSNSTGNVSILGITNCTGIVARNVVGTSKTATAGAIVPGSMFCFENYASNEVAKSGFLEPAADSN